MMGMQIYACIGNFKIEIFIGIKYTIIVLLRDEQAEW